MSTEPAEEPHGDYIHMTQPERVEFLRRREEWALARRREREEFVRRALERVAARDV